MSQLQILRYPDPRLYTVAKPVAEIDDAVRQLADEMIELRVNAYLSRNGVSVSLRHQGFAGRISAKFGSFLTGWILQPIRNCRSPRGFRLTCVPIAFDGPGVFRT